MSRERDLMAQQLRMTEERHSAMLHSAKDAEQRTEHEQQKLQAELQVRPLTLLDALIDMRRKGMHA